MITLSQRLLHTSLPHRLVGVRHAGTQTPQQIAAMRAAGDLLQRPPADATPAPTYQTGQPLPPYELSGEVGQQSPPSRPPLLGPPSKIAKQIDPFHISGSDPLDHVLNPAMARSFVNQMGRIKSRAETGLTWKSQRKVGKMVRRARAMGLISRWTDKEADSN